MRHVKGFVTLALLLVLSFPPGLRAQPQARPDAAIHVVSPDQLRATLSARTAERTRNIREIQKLLSHDEVRKQVGSLADMDKIERALPTLDDKTLARVAAKSRQANDQIDAGISTMGWVGIGVIAGVVVLLLICAANENGVCFGG